MLKRVISLSLYVVSISYFVSVYHIKKKIFIFTAKIYSTQKMHTLAIFHSIIGKYQLRDRGTPWFHFLPYWALLCKTLPLFTIAHPCFIYFFILKYTNILQIGINLCMFKSNLELRQEFTNSNLIIEILCCRVKISFVKKCYKLK